MGLEDESLLVNGSWWWANPISPQKKDTRWERHAGWLTPLPLRQMMIIGEYWWASHWTWIDRLGHPLMMIMCDDGLSSPCKIGLNGFPWRQGIHHSPNEWKRVHKREPNSASSSAESNGMSQVGGGWCLCVPFDSHTHSQAIISPGGKSHLRKRRRSPSHSIKPPPRKPWRILGALYFFFSFSPVKLGRTGFKTHTHPDFVTV